ncbi:MAG: DUF192 domain-containing protein [Nitrospiria bacterium]
MKYFKTIGAGFFFLIFLIPGCSMFSSGERRVTFPSGTVLSAEVADTPETRERGLMFRDHLPKGGALLFIFEAARPYPFWMKNCKFPIDIIWMNPDKKIIHIAKDTPPCTSDPCPTYGPKHKKALYVLEVAAGFSEKENLKQGMPILF